jgi:NAD(P)-dependent dehydrogenase (short-subunit alcohol dehydrogenase family)
MIISTSNLAKDSLKGKTAIVTGAGRGIGFETARALLWLGSNVIIAEIDQETGQQAKEKLEREFGAERTVFIKTDVGNEKDVYKLSKEATKKFGKVDIVINNATVFSMGAVIDKSIEAWDSSYRVNLRGPVLLAKKFLSEMLKNKQGVFVCVSSSGAAPYMGAYEVYKTAQVELANTIAAEIEGTGVFAFTIGPGIVRTPGFIDGGGQVASMMGMTLQQLLDMNKQHELSPEAAGAGFAAAIALAQKYHGQEVSSIQVLREIGIDLTDGKIRQTSSKAFDSPKARELFESVIKTYSDQSESWKKRNLFERQWVSRDFKKQTGMSTEDMLTTLKNLKENLTNNKDSSSFTSTLKQLSKYYEHQQTLLKGFEKNPQKLAENLKLLDQWITQITDLIEALSKN